MLLLSDEDVRGHIDMATAIQQMNNAFLEQAAGTFIGPARSSLQAPAGKLIFSKGGAVGQRDSNANVIGFRVFPIFKVDGATIDDDQMVVVYDSDSGRLKGIVTGKYIGSLRTGAINGLAADLMARKDARVLAVIGAGYQARTQIKAVLAVRPEIKQIVLFSRTYSRAEALKQYLERRFDASVQVAREAKEAVQAADILITATNSRIAIFKEKWLKAGTHINSIGPKFEDAHELPKEIIKRLDLIVTDSLAQISGYDRPYFLGDRIGMIGLDKLVSGSHPGRKSADEITLFSSTGLAGTEVVLANYLLDKFAKADK
ncbi:MAG: alanine dehydrogenase [Cellvibrionaceae bacterium]|jgi:alanine dehydrogenase